MPTIADRVAEVRKRLEAACERSGRHPSEVTLLAASKTRTVAEMLEARAAGVLDFGENYVQELLAKRDAIDKSAPECILWHLIGHLQRNKVRLLRPAPALIHSLDSVALAREIDRRAGEAGERQAVLIEVNVAGEATKAGVSPVEVRALAEALVELPHLQLQGLMAMPPYSDDPEASRPHLRRLRELGRQLGADLPPGSMRHLSMGMSGDWEVAVEEGATLIRLGTALFGPRARSGPAG